MLNRYTMSLEDNIFFAKRNLVDSIWKEASIEGIGISFPDVKEIVEGRVVAGISVNDTVAINNLRLAWQFVLDTLAAPVDLSYVQKVNSIVGAGIVRDAGQLRGSNVVIGGTSWKPKLPDPGKVQAMVEASVLSNPGQERAFKMFAYLCRAQLFYDGNKRTAQLVANRMLIEDGAGILAIPVEEKRAFERILVGFYESGNADELLAFLDREALDGMASVN